MTILQFESGAGVLRLPLNDPDGLSIAEGFDIGRAEVQHDFLHQPPYEPLLAGWSAVDRLWTIPLRFRPHVPAATRATLIETLFTEIRRDSNILRYQPPGWPFPYFSDTYPASEPDALTAWMHDLGVEKVGWLRIPAKPYLRTS